MSASTRPVVLHDQTNLLPRKKLLVVFSVMAMAFFVAYADQNGIAVAIPAITKDLHAVNTISWAGTSSMIANTVFQVLYGRLSDIFGRKVVYLSALVLLAVADILCATAQRAWALYLFRGLAGIATGGINSLTMMIVSDIVTLQERGRYQGILGSCIGLGNTIGPLISAAFVQSWSWRGFFYLICPLMLVCCAASCLLLPSTMPKGQGLEKAKLVDWYGLFFGSMAIIFILIPVSGGGSYFRWNSPMVISMLSIGGASVIGFIYVEWKVSRLPMVPSTLHQPLHFGHRLLSCAFWGGLDADLSSHSAYV
jgi:MFS family permease